MPHALFPTSLGVCGLAWSAAGITGFALPPVYSGFTDTGDEDQSGDPPEEIAALIVRVTTHLSGKPDDFGDVRYDFGRLSPFQRAVYEAALRVKAGDVRTYGWLATEAGRTTQASRAVGGALGQNPWPLLIPCHRFVGANGKMTGFSAPGGVVTKRKLLALEGAELLAED